MKIGETIALSDAAGRHSDLAGPCTGRNFRVSEIGSGGIYETRIECSTCGRGFAFYGNQVLDPLAEAAVEDTDGILYAVHVSYKFRNRARGGKAQSPDRFFKDHSRALGAFESITKGAARIGYRPVLPEDVLETATVKLFEHGQSDWNLQRQKEFRYP